MSSRNSRKIATPSIVDNIEASPWIPYTDDGDCPYPGALWTKVTNG